jgi:hypothetical protein
MLAPLRAETELIFPGDNWVLACFGRAHDSPWAGAEAGGCPPAWSRGISVDEARERLEIPRARGSRDLVVGQEG